MNFLTSQRRELSFILFIFCNVEILSFPSTHGLCYAKKTFVIMDKHQMLWNDFEKYSTLFDTLNKKLINIQNGRKEI